MTDVLLDNGDGTDRWYATKRPCDCSFWSSTNSKTCRLDIPAVLSEGE